MASLITGLTTGAVFRRLGSKYLVHYLPLDVIFILAYLFLLSGIAFAFVWHYSEKRKKVNLDYKHGLVQLIAFALALDLTMFGFQKLLGFQMIVPLGLLDTPFSSFSGEDLVWAFFKHSYAFTSVVAFMQMASAILLLFPKTRLFGSLIALPMLVFIWLMDFFYQMPTGVLLHGSILLTAIFYFLWLYRKRLLSICWINVSSVNFHYTWLWILLLMGISAFCLINRRHPDLHPQLTGKYAVADLKIEGLSQKAKYSTDSVLTFVYFDLDDDVVLRWNDHRRQRIGRYRLSNQGRITMKWRYPDNKLPAFEGQLIGVKDGFQLKGRMDTSNYEMLLIRDEK
ncbi:hypothetical protein DU508_03570 [Pedobacter chinensis]|uniref:Uncharacterized protein n=1 Tax=Pedobacter chinensis TaxID=2282421 RepID=A0A369Q435_9SPHI|nr:hypothetical protein [Pedobacter chinensis]RDC58037.1 hypothetical protein DU508_03570 [Pedobacter chinensis]